MSTGAKIRELKEAFEALNAARIEEEADRELLLELVAYLCAPEGMTPANITFEDIEAARELARTYAALRRGVGA